MANQIDRLILKLPPNRQLLGHLLMDKNWFKNTDFNLQKQILELPDNFEGYVFDLTQREDKFDSKEVVKLVKLSIGEHLIITVFDLYSSKTKKHTLKEYVSWCLGRHPGLKGLILIKTGNKITHFVTTKAEKFPIGHATFDAVGGLTQYSSNQIIHLSHQIKAAIQKKLNINQIEILDIYDLGRLEVDNGLTSNHPGIFAVTIDGGKLSVSSNSSKVDIIPIEQLESYISKVDDSFFLAIISRLLAKKIISL